MLMVHPNSQPQYAFISISATAQCFEWNIFGSHTFLLWTCVSVRIIESSPRSLILLANIIRIPTDFNIFFRISLTRFQVKVTLYALCFSWMHFSCNKMQLKNSLWLRICRFISNVLIFSNQSNLYLYLWLLSSITSAYTTCTEWSLLSLILYLIFSHLCPLSLYHCNLLFF